MKQTKFMAFLLFAGMTLVACDDDENEIDPSEQQNTMTLTFEGSSWNSLIDNPQYYGPLLYGENAKDYAWTDATTQLALGGHTVTLTQEGGGETTAVTDDNGIAHFTGLIPDVYTLSVSWPLTASEYREATGDNEVNDGAIVAGSSHSQLLTTDTKASPLTLTTQFTITRSLVISKVFYAGMKDVNKKNYLAAQYIELYNQGDEAVDIAGMYLGLVESNASPAYTLDQIGNVFQDLFKCRQGAPDHVIGNTIRKPQKAGTAEFCPRNNQKVVIQLCLFGKGTIIPIGGFHEQIKGSIRFCTFIAHARQRIVQEVSVFLIRLQIRLFIRTCFHYTLKQGRGTNMPHDPRSTGHRSHQFFRIRTVLRNKHITNPLSRQRQ